MRRAAALEQGRAKPISRLFYALDGRIRFGHSIWHIFVAGASVSHGIAVAMYASGVPR